jgi:hypothetical protein
MAPSSLTMQILPEGLGHSLAHARGCRQLFRIRRLYAPEAPEVAKQRLGSLGTYTRNL